MTSTGFYDFCKDVDLTVTENIIEAYKRLQTAHPALAELVSSYGQQQNMKIDIKSDLLSLSCLEVNRVFPLRGHKYENRLSNVLVEWNKEPKYIPPVILEYGSPYFGNNKSLTETLVKLTKSTREHQIKAIAKSSNMNTEYAEKFLQMVTDFWYKAELLIAPESCNTWLENMNKSKNDIVNKEENQKDCSVHLSDHFLSTYEYPNDTYIKETTTYNTPDFLSCINIPNKPDDSNEPQVTNWDSATKMIYCSKFQDKFSSNNGLVGYRARLWGSDNLKDIYNILVNKITPSSNLTQIKMTQNNIINNDSNSVEPINYHRFADKHLNENRETELKNSYEIKNIDTKYPKNIDLVEDGIASKTNYSNNLNSITTGFITQSTHCTSVGVESPDDFFVMESPDLDKDNVKSSIYHDGELEEENDSLNKNNLEKTDHYILECNNQVIPIDIENKNSTETDSLGSEPSDYESEFEVVESPILARHRSHNENPNSEEDVTDEINDNKIIQRVTNTIRKEDKQISDKEDFIDNNISQDSIENYSDLPAELKSIITLEQFQNIPLTLQGSISNNNELRDSLYNEDCRDLFLAPILEGMTESEGFTAPPITISCNDSTIRSQSSNDIIFDSVNESILQSQNLINDETKENSDIFEKLESRVNISQARDYNTLDKEDNIISLTNQMTALNTNSVESLQNDSSTANIYRNQYPKNFDINLNNFTETINSEPNISGHSSFSTNSMEEEQIANSRNSNLVAIGNNSPKSILKNQDHKKSELKSKCDNTNPSVIQGAATLGALLKVNRQILARQIPQWVSKKKTTKVIEKYDKYNISCELAHSGNGLTAGKLIPSWNTSDTADDDSVSYEYMPRLGWGENTSKAAMIAGRDRLLQSYNNNSDDESC